MFFNKSKRSTLMFSKSTWTSEHMNTCTQKLSKYLPWSSLFVFFNKSLCVVFSKLSCVHVCACTHCCLLAWFFFVFFVFLIHYVFLILKKTWISLGKFKLLLSCVSIFFGHLHHKTNVFALFFLLQILDLKSIHGFFLGGFIPCLMFSPFSWGMWQMTTK
jgi:hypothetical protein